jgi:hypothetical protein
MCDTLVASSALNGKLEATAAEIWTKSESSDLKHGSNRSLKREGVEKLEIMMF